MSTTSTNAPTAILISALASHICPSSLTSPKEFSPISFVTIARRPLSRSIFVRSSFVLLQVKYLLSMHKPMAMPTNKDIACIVTERPNRAAINEVRKPMLNDRR